MSGRNSETRDWLDQVALVEGLANQSAPPLRRLVVQREIDSTNRYLLDGVRHGLTGPAACLADYQTAGRGRRGRVWDSPIASGLCLSLLWSSLRTPAQLMGFSLAVGVAVARALEHQGFPTLGLKWPNDVYYDGRKLAGILVELAAHKGELTHCVIGVGINVQVPPGELTGTAVPWIDLASIKRTMGEGNFPSRNRLASGVLAELLRMAQQFDEAGLAPFLSDWQQRDVLVNRSVIAYLPGERVVQGIASGINPMGAFCLQEGDQLLQLASGEVSLRLVGGNPIYIPPDP